METEDQDRFIVAVSEAIAACRFYDELRTSRHEFWDDLVPQLHKWLTDHAEKVTAGYLTPRESGLLFLVVCHDVYDEALEEDLTRLDIDMARKHPLFSLDVLEVPNLDREQLASFIDTRVTPIEFQMGSGE